MRITNAKMGLYVRLILMIVPSINVPAQHASPASFVRIVSNSRPYMYSHSHLI